MKAPEDETMKWKRNAKDGVSPVIAVILMVAITVVLAGVVVLWVTRLSKTEEEAPEILKLDVSIYVTDSGAYMTIDNNGGGNIKWTNYKITIDGTPIKVEDSSNNIYWENGLCKGSNETNVGERETLMSITDPSITSSDVGDTLTVKIINIKTQDVVWEREIVVQSA